MLIKEQVCQRRTTSTKTTGTTGITVTIMLRLTTTDTVM